MMKIIDVEQGSEAWHSARCGMVTASCFSDVMAGGQGKVRDLYMRKLAGEIITGAPANYYTNANMERGNAMEDEARKMYSLEENSDVEQVGFMTNNCGPHTVGASPDGLIGKSGMLEIKTQEPHLLIDRHRGNGDMHMAQLQGCLWIAEREWIDLWVYWPKMKPWKQRVRRDENYIARLKVGVESFIEELNVMAKTYG
jgi:hypothetical protein